MQIRGEIETEKKHKFLKQGIDDIKGIMERCNNNDDSKEKIYRRWVELQAHMNGFVALMESTVLGRTDTEKQHGCE